MTPEQKLVYLAGVLDYRGSIRMVMRRGRSVPIVNLEYRSHARMVMFTEAFGGELTYRAGGDLWVFQRSHGKAVEILQKIRPYLMFSGEVADEGLRWSPIRKKAQAKKVPCPNQCGNMKQRGSAMCRPCRVKAQTSLGLRQRRQPTPVVSGNPWMQLVSG